MSETINPEPKANLQQDSHDLVIYSHRRISHYLKPINAQLQSWKVSVTANDIQVQFKATHNGKLYSEKQLVAQGLLDQSKLQSGYNAIARYARTCPTFTFWDNKGKPFTVSASAN